MSTTHDDLDATVVLISSERLEKFMTAAGTRSAAIELHHHSLRIGSTLGSVVGLIEIATRNAVAHQLESDFGVREWLTNPPAPFRWRGEERIKIQQAISAARRAEYAKLSNQEKKALDIQAYPQGVPPDVKHLQRAKARQRALAVTQGQLIAHLTLFFWKRLFSRDYEDTLWRRTLKRVFPQKQVTRADVAVAMEAIYQARNRVAHYELVEGRRLEEALKAVEFLAQSLGRAGSDGLTPLSKLLDPHRLELDREIASLRKTTEQLGRHQPDRTNSHSSV